MVKLSPSLCAEVNATLVAQANQDGPPSPIAVWLQRFPVRPSCDTGPF
jgi:hypothetical protein